jgi:hypothetical protein
MTKPNNADRSALLSQIQELVEKFQFEQAHTICCKASKLFPGDHDILETLGSVEVELGLFQNAYQVKELLWRDFYFLTL